MKRSLPWVLVAIAVLALAWWRTSGGRSRALLPPVVEAVEAPAVSLLPPQAPPPRTALDVGPAPEARRAPLRVITTESLTRGAARVPRIAFQVFPRREQVPEPVRPTILPPVPLTPVDEPVSSGRTDERGEASVELDLGRVKLDANGLPLVCVRVVEPGYQQQVFSGRAPEDEPGLLEVQLVARRGATARGRVVDAAGAPASADVRMGRWIEPPAGRRLGHGPGARQLCDGWFELHLDQAVEDGLLLADAGELGTCSLTGVRIPLEDPPQALVVVVRGEGSLRGRIVDGSGAPAAGVEVLVLVGALDDERGSFVLPEPGRSLLELEGRGRTHVTTSTDSAGRFEARGLRPEPCVVRARVGQGHTGGYPLLLTPRAVPADGSELLLRLERPALLVRLLDAEGQPWSGALPQTLQPYRMKLQRDGWPAQPHVIAFACDDLAGGSRTTGAILHGKPVGPAEVVYEVAAGARCLVAAIGPGFDGIPREVLVPPGSGTVAVELRARDLGELGAISVRVVHAGQELTGAWGQEELDIDLESADFAAPLLAIRPGQARAPFVFRAPAGSYRVVAAGKASTSIFHGTLMRSRELGRAEAEVVVRAGVTQEITLDLEAGARLEVTLAGRPDEADRLAARERDPWIDPLLAPEERETAVLRRAALAELHLIAPGRRREAVVRAVFAYENTSAAGEHLLNEWLLGETELSERLPAGRYVLVARLPGGRESRAEVELFPGETTRVSLGF